MVLEDYNIIFGGMMDEDIGFLDVVLISRIDNDTTLENFGGRVNTTYFEAANLMGTLKVKGLVTFEQSVGGQSPVKITDKAKRILGLMNEKSEEQFTDLDTAILRAIASGANNSQKIEEAVNVASFDVALHINKLYVQAFLDYTIRNSVITIRLTEKGFGRVKGVRIVTTKNKKDDDKKEIETEHNDDDYSNSDNVDDSGLPPQTPSEIKVGKDEIKSKMLMSKLEFYIGKYWWVFVLIPLLIIILIVFFLVLSL